MNIENAFSIKRSNDIELGSLCLFKIGTEYLLGLAVTTSYSSDPGPHSVSFLHLTNEKNENAHIFHSVDLSDLNVIDLGKNYQIITSTKGSDYSVDGYRTTISLFGMANDRDPRQKNLYLKHPGYYGAPLLIDLGTGCAVPGALSKQIYCHSWKIVDQNNEVIFEMTNNQ